MANPISEQNKSAALNFDPDLINSVITEKGLQDLKNSKEKVEEIKREIATLLDQPRPLAAESRPVEKLNSVETDALLAFSLMMNLDKEVFSLPAISDPNSKSLNLNEQQILLIKFFKAIALTGAATSSFLNEGNLEGLKKLASAFTNSSFRLVIQKSDLIHLDEWVKEIVQCQRLFHKALPSQRYETGNSKGITCSIKKNGELRGWLFGTMHNLSEKQMSNADKLNETCYQRLKQCSILGTEIKISLASDETKSVESSLIKFAQANALVNLGMDSLERGSGEKTQGNQQGGNPFAFIGEEGLLSLIQQEGISEENKSLLQKLLQSKQTNEKAINNLALLYQSGDYQKLKETFEALVLEMGESDTTEVKEKRQTDLIQNTHACLLALEKSKDQNMETPKGFFAYGFAHIFCDKVYRQTMITGLRELGWEVEPELI